MVIKKSDTVREKKTLNPTYSVPTISLPVEDERVLLYLLKEEKMNVRRYSIINRIPRSTVYDSLIRLNKINLVVYENRNIRISELGKTYLKKTNKTDIVGVGASRLECRDNKLSTHIKKFILPISDKRKFRDLKLNSIKSLGWKPIKMNNWIQYIIKFEDANIVINPNEVRIGLNDLISDNLNESDEHSLSRLIDYVNLLKNIGILTEGALVEEEGHWARVNSVLAEWLCSKIDNKYFLELDDGTKFWIDFSNNKIEDETNKKIARSRLDKNIGGIMSGKYELDNININREDISEIREALFSITTMEKVRLMDRIEQNKLKRIELEKQAFIETKLNFTPSYIN